MTKLWHPIKSLTSGLLLQERRHHVELAQAAIAHVPMTRQYLKILLGRELRHLLIKNVQRSAR